MVTEASLRVVHKYPLVIEPLGQDRTIKIGSNPMFLHVDRNTHDVRALYIWFEVDADGSTDYEYHYCVLGTGRATSIPDEDRIHLGTVMDDPYVWHVYEVFHDVARMQEVSP